jgi:four helix bundle protein
MDLVEMVYQLANEFPDDERFRLTNQMTRAAISIPANIAEGNARGSLPDYARFVAISKGSAMETETYVLIAIRLNYTSAEAATPILDLITEISKMLTALRSRLLS